MVKLFLTCFAFIIMIPLYFFYDMKGSNRESPSTIIRYGFLFVGYKKKYYYYEFLKIFFKSIIIVIVSSSDYEGKTFINLAAIILILFMINIYFMKSFKPHDRDKFNNWVINS